jgi:NitT/TauT family transport system ATP-binding protein
VVADELRAGARKTSRGVALEVRGVSHRFELKNETLHVLEDVDFTAEPGELIAILGPSGSGKSTLLRLVTGLDGPTSGEILVDGRLVDKPDPSRPIVFQDPTLFPWRTVRGNVQLGLEARGLLAGAERKVQEIIELVGLGGFEKAHPHQLSGGMAQRAAIARVLVNEPRLLLLDEPLGQLDALTRLTMQREILRLWETGGFTSLLVTHDVDEALYLATRVIVLSARPGRVLADVGVDAPRPRQHDDPRLADLRHHVLGLLGFDD